MFIFQPPFPLVEGKKERLKCSPDSVGFSSGSFMNIVFYKDKIVHFMIEIERNKERIY